MRFISILVLAATASIAALTLAKKNHSAQKPQINKEATIVHKHATATFGLDSWDEKAFNEIDGAPKLTRVTSTKSYQGDIEGQGKLEYLMMYRPDGTATFVGLERITGTIGGRSGSFVLQHSGVFESGEAKTILSILPGSGTGDLSNISGQGAFNVRHDPPYTMTLDYNLD